MKIQIKIKSGAKFITKKVEVSGPTILSLLSAKASREIYRELGVAPFEELNGYVVSITDKD